MLVATVFAKEGSERRAYTITRILPRNVDVSPDAATPSAV
jgi:hypothetical protein